MNKTQVIVELINVEFHCSNRERALECLLFAWVNERFLPMLETIKIAKSFDGILKGSST